MLAAAPSCAVCMGGKIWDGNEGGEHDDGVEHDEDEDEDDDGYDNVMSKMIMLKGLMMMTTTMAMVSMTVTVMKMMGNDAEEI